jgi:hypothetical protein
VWITLFQEGLCSFRCIFSGLKGTHDQVDEGLAVGTGDLHKLSEKLFMCLHMERGRLSDDGCQFSGTLYQLFLWNNFIR